MRCSYASRNLHGTLASKFPTPDAAVRECCNLGVLPRAPERVRVLLGCSDSPTTQPARKTARGSTLAWELAGTSIGVSVEGSLPARIHYSSGCIHSQFCHRNDPPLAKKSRTAPESTVPSRTRTPSRNYSWSKDTAQSSNTHPATPFDGGNQLISSMALYAQPV